jgi:hypothetical protein
MKIVDSIERPKNAAKACTPKKCPQKPINTNSLTTLFQSLPQFSTKLQLRLFENNENPFGFIDNSTDAIAS